MEGGGMNLMEMWNQMGYTAKGIAVVLFFMSFWSVGVAVERKRRPTLGSGTSW